ncbi:hypothetical protein PR202_gb25212 [Eleusine coracana subsp. coracana]|uniref:DUF6598 domain-containing protein n=1 Tax=Eleusine coracana subsp. coracana TaxID=191504 RepID=A0AAV5FN50_ELECO|nr:hypothetical protein PR202_gb25212 [Eleusine coracana subsp. coracana]
MRYTDTSTKVSANKYGTICNQGRRWFHPSDSANVFSVKIVSSSVGFPVHVYGTVIARDSLDSKCVYLFRRDRDNCQLINSVVESLTLSGPKRGLELQSDIYVEIDLKIKGDQGQDDKEFSKGFLQLDGFQYRTMKDMVVESDSLDSKLSTVEVTFAIVKRAVEATIAIEVLHGEFNGSITVKTTRITESLVLYDSKIAGVKNGVREGSIQLLRPVVAVCAEESLTLNVAGVSDSGEIKYSTVEVKAAVNGRETTTITCGTCTLLVKIAWSIISRD